MGFFWVKYFVKFGGLYLFFLYFVLLNIIGMYVVYLDKNKLFLRIFKGIIGKRILKIIDRM